MQSACYQSLGLGKINPAWSNVISGFAVQIVLGTLYLWGNITPITTSYLRKYDPTLTYNDTLFVYIVALAFNGLFVMFSGYFQTTFGPRMCVIVGGYLICFAALCSSYCTSLSGFIFTQGAMFGAGFGITYSVSFTCAIQWLPERKALLTGLVISGVGFGTSFFSNYAMRFLNPDNLSISDVAANHTAVGEESGASASDAPPQHYYPPDSDIPGRVPEFYFNLSAIYFVLVTIGVVMCYPHDRNDPYFKSFTEEDKDNDNDDQVEEESISLIKSKSSPTSSSARKTFHLDSETDAKDVTVKDETRGSPGARPPSAAPLVSSLLDLSPNDLVHEPMCFLFEMCMVFTNVGGMYIAGVFKNMGENHFQDEVFLASVGTSAALSNTLGRLTIGAIADKFGPLRTLHYLNIVLSAVLITYAYTPYMGEEAYALSTCLIQFLLGGNLCIYPSACIVLFGGANAGGNYGVFYSVYNGMIVMVTSVIWMYDIDIFVSTMMLGGMCFMGTIGVHILDRQLVRINPLQMLVTSPGSLKLI